MGRPLRAAEGGYVDHVLNRANPWMAMFEDDGDFEAFERVLLEAVERTETRLLCCTVMPNHRRRFKSFPVADNDHFDTVARYVERERGGRERITEKRLMCCKSQVFCRVVLLDMACFLGFAESLWLQNRAGFCSH